MYKHVSEVAGEAMLRFVRDKKDGVNTNKVYTIYEGDSRFYNDSSNNYKTPLDYINAKKLSKVRKR